MKNLLLTAKNAKNAKGMEMLLAAIALIGALGCSYAPRQYPLQPGEMIIFETDARANEYRGKSMNDLFNTNRVVKITRPTSVSCE